MGDVITARAYEPPSWILVFHRTTNSRLVRWFAPGPYKHVSAYAYIPGLKAWLFYDVRLYFTRIIVAPDGPESLAVLGETVRDADLIAVRCNPDRRAPRGVFRFGFWCVPAIKHLIGLSSSALRPDALYRDVLAAGGQPLGRHANPDLSAAGA